MPRANKPEDIGMLAIAVQKLVSERRTAWADRTVSPEERAATRQRLNREIVRARNTLLVAIRSWRRRNECQP